MGSSDSGGREGGSEWSGSDNGRAGFTSSEQAESKAAETHGSTHGALAPDSIRNLLHRIHTPFTAKFGEKEWPGMQVLLLSGADISRLGERPDVVEDEQRMDAEMERAFLEHECFFQHPNAHVHAGNAIAHNLQIHPTWCRETDHPTRMLFTAYGAPTATLRILLARMAIVNGCQLLPDEVHAACDLRAQPEKYLVR